MHDLDEDKKLENIDDHNNKKWLLNRIELYLDACDDELRIEQERFDSFSKDYLSTFNNLKGYVLTTLGILVTIVVGIATIVPKPGEDLFYLVFTSIIVPVGVSLVFFIIILVLSNKASAYFNRIKEAYTQTISRLYATKGFYIVKSERLPVTSIQKLYVIFYFAIVVYEGQFEFLDAYERCSKSRLFWRKRHRIFLMTTSNVESARIYGAYGLYEKWESLFIKHILYLGEMMSLLEPFFDIDSTITPILGKPVYTKKIDGILATVLIVVLGLLLYDIIRRLIL
jgi:hypothetical protein